jgi:translation initiation factor IF-2
MTDDRNKSIQNAGPATPVELSGIDKIPDAGDKFYVCDSLKKAEQVALQYREHERQRDLAGKTKVTLDTFADKIKSGQTKHLRVVLKADVQGSVDVLTKSLNQIGTDEVSVSVLHAAVGGITESDVLLADASEAVIIGFQVAVTPPVRAIAETRDVDIRLYRVIYELTDDVRKALEGMLDPERKEEELGTAEVRQMFKISKVGLVAGCLVTNGVIQRGNRSRLIRDGLVVTEDRELESLRRIKEDVREVRSGTECGIRIAGFEDIKPGDSISCYTVVEVKRSLAST